MRLLMFFLCLCGTIALSSCGSYKVEDDDMPDNGGQNQQATYLLSLRIGSQDNAQVNYPLSAFIFDSMNGCVFRDNIAAIADEHSFSLSKGKYNVIVISGLEGNGFGYPLQYVPESYISLPEPYYSSVPLQSGKVSVNLAQSAVASVTLSYRVAALRFSLIGIPKNATSVEVKVSPVSSAVTFEGDYKNDLKEASIVCREQNGRWVSDDVYVFPCNSSQTRLSINVVMPDKTEAYGYIYQAMLQPGSPYHFTGAYADAIMLDGQFQSQGWKQVTDIEFGFDEVTPVTPEPSEPSVTPDPTPSGDIPLISVETLPEEKDFWQECLVFGVQQVSSSERTAVIIANDYMKMLSSSLDAYLEDFSFAGLTGWRVFTTEEATSFRNKYFGTNGISGLNSYLLSYGVDPFKHEDGDRYLCNGGQSTFSFLSKTISAAGEKKSYYVRPVKTVRFKLNK